MPERAIGQLMETGQVIWPSVKWRDAPRMRVDTPWLEADTREVTRAWSAYVAARRAGHGRKRPVADIMIGAFAARQDGLITRNPDDFRPWFPRLKIIGP